MTAQQVLQLLENLDARDIVRVLEALCSELVGPCNAAVFVFVTDDQTLLLPFGEGGDEKPMPARDMGMTDLIGSASPLAVVPGAGAAGRALLLLEVGGDPIGVVRLDLARPLTGDGVAILKALAQPLATAVRNGQRFEETKKLTLRDDLTGLYNSRFMAAYLDREIKRCRRVRSPLCLLFMDLDGFKSVNDTHGHLAGSRTLVEVGAVLEETVRDADVLIRYGGDEFVILFPETPLSGGLVIAERIRQVIASTKFLETLSIEARVSASIGLAAYPESADDVRGLISGADRAMYEAKALGKNRVVAAGPLPPIESPKRS